MGAQELYNLQEAYLSIYEDIEQLDETSSELRARVALKRHQELNSARKAEEEAMNDGAHNDMERLSRVGDRVERAALKVAKHRALSIDHARSRARMRKRGIRVHDEGYDLYDTILSHLLDEGFAETPEAAEVIMVNMSEEWRDSIIERKEVPKHRRLYS